MNIIILIMPKPKEAWVESKRENLYNVVRKLNTPVYSINGNLLGYYSGTSSIAHNGKCHGYGYLKDTNDDNFSRCDICVGGDVTRFKDGWKLVK
jgi:hypothetical protein